MATMRENKQAIRRFMREHYTDERLAMLLAHAQSGRLAFRSCCCFIAIPTADHTLQGACYFNEPHYRAARTLDPSTPTSVWGVAEQAYHDIVNDSHDDAKRRRILIPMIRAEMHRRERIAASVSAEFAAEVEHEG
jgi:hypothetical protein